MKYTHNTRRVGQMPIDQSQSWNSKSKMKRDDDEGPDLELSIWQRGSAARSRESEVLRLTAQKVQPGSIAVRLGMQRSEVVGILEVAARKAETRTYTERRGPGRACDRKRRARV